MTDDESGKLDRLFSGADEADGAPAADTAGALKGQIAALLWDKRYEEALELLYAARWHMPDAPEISRGIKLLKERLVRRYVDELGDLDTVPSIAPGVSQAAIEITDEERALLHLIDGISSFADIAHQSRLGRFETYRALGCLVRGGIVEVAPPPAPTPVPRRASSPASAGLQMASAELEKTPPLMPISEPERLAKTSRPPASAAPHRWRGLLVGAVSFAITGTVGFTWWAITGSAPSLHPGAAVASVPVSIPIRRTSASEGSRSESQLVATTPAHAGAHPLALPEPAVKAAPPADPSVSAAPGTLGRSARSGDKSEDRSKKRSSRGAGIVELASAGRPHQASTTPVTRAAAAPSPGSSSPSRADEDDAPSLPELADHVAGTARPAALATSSSLSARPPSSGSADAPQGLVKASATSFAPATVSIATNEVTVRGSLGRSVVEQAITRAQADFRSCYSARAAAVRRDAAGTARVSLTIDEAGYATAVSAHGAPLPGLDGCLQEAASRIRTRVHPDVGLATVAFAVVFSIGGPAR